MKMMVLLADGLMANHQPTPANWVEASSRHHVGLHLSSQRGGRRRHDVRAREAQDSAGPAERAGGQQGGEDERRRAHPHRINGPQTIINKSL